jgi:hypothetical protein
MSRRPVSVSPAPVFDVAALPATGAQFRTVSGATGTPQASAYAQATRALAAWAKPSGNAPLVHALVHLGWCSGSGARAICRASSSAAFKHGQAHLEVGSAAAPQVVAVLTALTEAGAPAEQISTVWATFTGQAA